MTDEATLEDFRRYLEEWMQDDASKTKDPNRRQALKECYAIAKARYESPPEVKETLQIGGRNNITELSDQGK
jgi:hypothetical protein